MKVLISYLIFLLSFYAIDTANISTKKQLTLVTTTQTTNSTKILNETKTGLSKSDLSSNTAATAAPVSVTPKLNDVTPPIRPRKTQTSTTTTTTIPPRKSPPPKKYIGTVTKTITSDGPTKISLSKSKISLPPAAAAAPPARRPISTKTISREDNLQCPKENEAQFRLFAPPCQTDRDCTSWNKEERCCSLFGSRNCIKGVPKPLKEQEHAPFFGLIARKCPKRPLAELWWDLKTCDSDNDCWPRICCPDGRRKYCRSSAPEYNSVPSPIRRPLIYLSEYLECTPPPPPIFDVHPKSCETTLDCFPNVCCQEAGQKHCRPPKKSLLTFMANFLNTGLLKRLTTNLVIK